MALGRLGDGNWVCANHLNLRFSYILVHVCVYISIVIIEHVHVHVLHTRSAKLVSLINMHMYRLLAKW